MDKTLIFDIGLHKGEDTEYYLRRGFKVVAVEADIDLCKYCSEKFSDEIERGNLIIVNGAISNSKDESIAFYKNTKFSVWGTIVKSWAERNERLGAGYEVTQVRVIQLIELFKQYGVPYYLKIDIEGMDFTALESLQNSLARPKFISIESEKIEFEKLKKEIEVFCSLGYSHFQAVEQSGVSKQQIPFDSQEGNYVPYRFPFGSSGLFGTDLRTNWLTKDQIELRYRKIFTRYKLFGDNSLFIKLYPLRKLKSLVSKLTGVPMPGWYDTHAKHSSVLSKQK